MLKEVSLQKQDRYTVALDVDDLIDFKIAELMFLEKGMEWLMT